MAFFTDYALNYEALTGGATYLDVAPFFIKNMTNKEKIKVLESRVLSLEAKISGLESGIDLLIRLMGGKSSGFEKKGFDKNTYAFTSEIPSESLKLTKAISRCSHAAERITGIKEEDGVNIFDKAINLLNHDLTPEKSKDDFIKITDPFAETKFEKMAGRNITPEGFSTLLELLCIDRMK